MTVPAIAIGIPPAGRKAIADELGTLLADTYTLYLKTHGYHWNVTGPLFQSLHLLFEAQYNELWTAVDLIAERMRSLGHKVPVGNTTFAKLARVKDGKATEALDMVRDLVQGHETVVRTLRKAWPVADKHADQATLDLLTQRLAVHEKTAWMLRALLE